MPKRSSRPSDDATEVDRPAVEAGELRSFGRRRGRKPSRHQQQLLRDELPRWAVDTGVPPPAPLASLFAVPVDDVWLEVGFGDGQHLLWQAARNPNVGLIGCEPFQDGILRVLGLLHGAGPSNVRLHADDVRPLLRWLPPASIGCVFVLFPDPWPKKRHLKRRLLNASSIDLIGRVMRPGTTLHVATDAEDYADAILRTVAEHPGRAWVCAPSASTWPPTRYELKARSAGRRARYLSFIRR